MIYVSILLVCFLDFSCRYTETGEHSTIDRCIDRTTFDATVARSLGFPRVHSIHVFCIRRESV